MTVMKIIGGCGVPGVNPVRQSMAAGFPDRATKSASPAQMCALGSWYILGWNHGIVWFVF